MAIHEIALRNPQSLFHLYTARLRPSLPFTETIGNVHIHRIGIGSMVDRILLPCIAPIVALCSTSRALPTVIWGMMAQYGGMAALLFHLLTRKKHRFVLTLQEGGDFTAMQKRAGLMLPLMKQVVCRCTTLQTISHALLGWAQNLGYTGSDYHVIPNGVDSKRFANKPPTHELQRWHDRLGLDDTTKVIFSASRLSPKNGMNDLAQAAALLPAHYLCVIAGDGIQRPLIEQTIRAHSLDKRVIMLGDCSYEDVIILLHVSHLFVRPSLSEGLGNAFLEAMAAGVPIVGTMVGGIPDFLEDGVTGLAAEPGNAQSIAACIRHYEDKRLYASIQRAGQQLVAKQFDWDLIANRMDTIFCHP